MWVLVKTVIGVLMVIMNIISSLPLYLTSTLAIDKDNIKFHVNQKINSYIFNLHCVTNEAVRPLVSFNVLSNSSTVFIE